MNTETHFEWDDNKNKNIWSRVPAKGKEDLCRAHNQKTNYVPQQTRVIDFKVIIE